MIKKIKAKSIRPGPLRHESLDKEGRAIARYTYKRLGHFLYPSFEQWEHGFLRDMHPENELILWLRASVAFKRYLDKHPRANVKDVHHDIIYLLGANKPVTHRQRELRRLFSEAGQEDLDRAIEEGWRDDD